MTIIKIITKFLEVFSQFENAINISSVKNWFKFFWVLLKPFDFIKRLEKKFVIAGPRGNSMARPSFCL